MESDITNKYVATKWYRDNYFRVLIVLMIVLIAASCYGSCVYSASNKTPKKMKWDKYYFRDYYQSGADTHLYWFSDKSIKKTQIYQKVGSKWKLKKTTGGTNYKFRGKYGKTYYFKIRGVNGKKKGAFSKVLKVKVKRPKYVAGDVKKISTINGKKVKIKVTEYYDTWQPDTVYIYDKSWNKRDEYRTEYVTGNVVESDMRFWKKTYYRNGKIKQLIFGRCDNAIYRGESGHLYSMVDGDDGLSDDNMHTKDYSIMFEEFKPVQGCVYSESAEICWSLDGIEPYHGQEDRIFSVTRDSGGNVIKEGICPGFLDPNYPYYDKYEIFRYKTAGTIRLCDGEVEIIKDQSDVGKTDAEIEYWMKAFVNGKLSFERYEHDYGYDPYEEEL